MRRTFIAFIVAMGFLPLHSERIQAGYDTPAAAVTDFQNLLIETMKSAETTTVLERYKKLRPGVEKAFYLPLMAQIATGKHWKKSSKNDRANAANAFLRMSVSTLATLFDGYSGESFKHRAVKDGPSKTKLVVTDLVKSDKSTIDITYVTINVRGNWQIIDVVVDGGISELNVRKSEYNLVLKKNGIQGLINLLNGKADELMSQ